MVTNVREGNKVVGETLIGPKQPLAAEARPSLYDDSDLRLGRSGSCGGDRSRNGDLDAGIPLVPADKHWHRRSSRRRLYLWHKLRPVKDDDVENKRPLGLG